MADDKPQYRECETPFAIEHRERHGEVLVRLNARILNNNKDEVCTYPAEAAAEYVKAKHAVYVEPVAKAPKATKVDAK